MMFVPAPQHIATSDVTFSGPRRQRQTPRAYTAAGATPPANRESWIGREIDTYIGLSHLQRDLPASSPCVVLGASAEQLASMAGISILSQNKGEIPSRSKRHEGMERYRNKYPLTAINNAPGWFDGALKFHKPLVPVLEELLRRESRPIADSSSGPSIATAGQKDWRQMNPVLRKACGKIRVDDALNWRRHARLPGDKPVVVLMNNLVHYFNRPKADGSPGGDRDTEKIDVLLDTFKGLPVGSLIVIGRHDFQSDIRTDLRLKERGLKPIPIKRSPRGVVEDMSYLKTAPALLEEVDKPFIFKVV